mmetsp:Transcript_8534/g.16705  ORF Transcript_8534/g.16705 Transcript_8534/m.16705 type:complete len:208 (+) Transcript_8534:1354-1977(+)
MYDMYWLAGTLNPPDMTAIRRPLPPPPVAPTAEALARAGSPTPQAKGDATPIATAQRQLPIEDSVCRLPRASDPPGAIPSRKDEGRWWRLSLGVFVPLPAVLSNQLFCRTAPSLLLPIHSCCLHPKPLSAGEKEEVAETVQIMSRLPSRLLRERGRPTGGRCGSLIFIPQPDTAVTGGKIKDHPDPSLLLQMRTQFTTSSTGLTAGP